MPGRGAAENSHDGANIVPPGKGLMAPLRDFFDAERRTFGKQQDQTAIEGFGGMVHVADDVAWNQGQTTVVAIGDGLVRYVGCSATWGYMVIIEHLARGPGGRNEIFCSLYAHLGPFVSVNAGQTVDRGDKVAVVGRTYTWENGGYVASVDRLPLKGSGDSVREAQDQLVHHMRAWIETHDGQDGLEQALAQAGFDGVEEATDLQLEFVE